MFPQTRLGLVLCALLFSGCTCAHKGSGGGNGDGLVGLQGTAQAQDLAFGEVAVGQSKTLTLTVQNPGSAALGVGNVALAGSDPSDFAATGSSVQGQQINPGASLTLPVTFTPSVTGARSATLAISFTDAPALDVQLTGTGVALTVSATPDPVNFGDVQVGAPAATVTATLSNAGDVAAQVTAGTITGPQAALFGVEGKGGAISAGGTLPLTVTFQPTAPGSAIASLPLQICSTDPALASCTSLTLPLEGNGIDGTLAFNPDPVTFGTVPAGSSATQTVTISNPGTADVKISSLATASGSSAVFALQGLPSFPADLPAGKSLTVSVKYTATGNAGGDSDGLVAAYLVSGTISRSATDPLLGSGALSPCALVLAPTALAFGTVSAGAHAQQTLSLANKGQTACSVTALQLGPGSDPAFGVDPATPASLSIPGGGSGSIAVDFYVATAAAPLARTGSLTFRSSDPNQPQLTVPLSATLSTQGFACALSVTPTALNFGNSLTVGTPSTLQVTLTNTTANATCNVTGIKLSSGTPSDFSLPSATPIALGPGNAGTISVTFDAASATPPLYTGDLLFATDDPTQANVDVPLSAGIGGTSCPGNYPDLVTGQTQQGGTCNPALGAACAACVQDSDCPTGNWCVMDPTDGNGYCGLGCGHGQACPATESCQAETDDGTLNNIKACYPTSGTCSATGGQICTSGLYCGDGGYCWLDGSENDPQASPLQFVLSWDHAEDLDLHVFEPGGCQIDYANLSCVGTLNHDAWAACSQDGLTLEQVTYPHGTTPPAGTYTVIADFYQCCDANPATAPPIPWVLQVRNGANVSSYCGTFTCAQADSDAADSTATPNVCPAGDGGCVVVTQFTLGGADGG